MNNGEMLLRKLLRCKVSRKMNARPRVIFLICFSRNNNLCELLTEKLCSPRAANKITSNRKLLRQMRLLSTSSAIKGMERKWINCTACLDEVKRFIKILLSLKWVFPTRRTAGNREVTAINWIDVFSNYRSIPKEKKRVLNRVRLELIDRHRFSELTHVQFH